MSNNDPINPEIVNEENKKINKPGNGKKILAWILFIGAVLYGISPVDAIPDVIPVLGISDDIVLGLITLANLIYQSRRK